jgi:hypothetical protein
MEFHYAVHVRSYFPHYQTSFVSQTYTFGCEVWARETTSLRVIGVEV